MKPYSVVIPTFRNAEVKSACLRAVVRCLEASLAVIQEVVVVDNDVDGTGVDELVRHTRLPVRVARCAARNQRAASRNLGASLASAPYLVFLDDDILVPNDVLGDLMGELRPGAFWTCAERRYVPIEVSRQELFDAARRKDEAWLRAVSTPVVGETSCDRYWMKTHLFTFVSCFGVVPRLEFLDLGGFDERFVGWGLEDTELMSRLIRRLELKSLYRRHCVFHCDHFVSPYNWIEHGRNLTHFVAALESRDQEFDLFRFAEAVTRTESFPTNPTLPLVPRCIQAEAIDSDRRALVLMILDELRTRVELTSRVLGCMLVGSAAHSSCFRDLDFIFLTADGDRIRQRRVTSTGYEVELELTPLWAVSSILESHRHSPETWPLEVGKWAHGKLLYDTDGVLSETSVSLPRG